MFITAAAGFRHPVAVPGSQHSQLLASEFPSAQGHSATPSVGTDHFTHTGRCPGVPWSPSQPAVLLPLDTHKYFHTQNKSLVLGHCIYSPDNLDCLICVPTVTSIPVPEIIIHGIIKHPELEGIHKNHQVQL